MKKGILSERLSKNRFDLLLFQKVVNETIFAGVILFHVHVSFLKCKSIVFTLWTAVTKNGERETGTSTGKRKKLEQSTCKSFWRVCDFDSVFLTIKKIKERFLSLNPTVYDLKLHKSDKNSRNLPRLPITDLPTMCLSLLCFCSLIITAHKALDFKLISIEFVFFFRCFGHLHLS